jgi:hypothetical protein
MTTPTPELGLYGMDMVYYDMDMVYFVNPFYRSLVDIFHDDTSTPIRIF